MIHVTLMVCWSVLAAGAACLSLPGSCELILLSVAALLPRRLVLPAPSPAPWSAAVLVPAHNEQASITSCVQALLRSSPAGPGTKMSIFVIADNCGDKTAQLAAAAGAQVIERNDPTQLGKGYALDYAFTRLIEQGYDCMIVVDADTRVEPNFVAACSDAMRAGAQAVQARYLVHNAQETTRNRLMSVALRAFNVVRPLGRQHLGLSCGIGGNGFGLRSNTLVAVPYLAASIVEDLEYHIELVRSGYRVTFLNHATVYAESPVQAAAVKTQRARWEGGRFRMLATRAPSLLRDVLSGRLGCLEPLFELLLLPLAFHVILVMVALSSRQHVIHDLGLAGVLIVLLHLLAAIVVGGGSWSDVFVLAYAPFYIVWKLLLIPTLLRNALPGGQWIRTRRNAEEPATLAPTSTTL